MHVYVIRILRNQPRKRICVTYLPLREHGAELPPGLQHQPHSPLWVSFSPHRCPLGRRCAGSTGGARPSRLLTLPTPRGRRAGSAWLGAAQARCARCVAAGARDAGGGSAWQVAGSGGRAARRDRPESRWGGGRRGHDPGRRGSRLRGPRACLGAGCLSVLCLLAPRSASLRRFGESHRAPRSPERQPLLHPGVSRGAPRLRCAGPGGLRIIPAGPRWERGQAP